VLESGKPHHWEVRAPDGSVIDAYDFPFTDMDSSALILEMDIDITERKRTEEALRESENRLRLLSSQLLVAQEKERRVAAQEIHDSLGASLAATKFKVESALSEIGNDNPQIRVALESIIPIIRGTIEEARRIQMNLRPSILDDLGILATIGWFCRQYESTYSAIRVKQEINIEEHEVSDSLKTVIFRVLQEAMNNVAKHSEANQVILALNKTDQAIELVVRDNGHGFKVEDILSRKRSSRGLGLDSMRERTELAGGRFTIESTDLRTVIQASWPLQPTVGETTK
jgi:signal transduction histidine kinase